MKPPIRVFIGYDQREAIAYHVCCQSILSRARAPVAFYPLALNLFSSDYLETHTDGSNAFIYSRFLIPWLCNFQGRAIYIDSDVLVRGDIWELWDKSPQMFVGASVVKHDYQTKHPTKYLGARNDDYPRKNWSSVIVWNCNYFPNRVLSPEFVAKQAGSYLHRFSWLKDNQIGDLPVEWNKLVSEQELSDEDRLRHFTIGTPCFEGYEKQEGAGEWFNELDAAMAPYAKSRQYVAA